MGVDTGALGPWICDRSSRDHPGMGARVSVDRTTCLSDLVRQCPLSARSGETRRDTGRNGHPCAFGATDSRLETSARRLTRNELRELVPRPSASRKPHHICIPGPQKRPDLAHARGLASLAQCTTRSARLSAPRSQGRSEPRHSNALRSAEPQAPAVLDPRSRLPIPRCHQDAGPRAEGSPRAMPSA